MQNNQQRILNLIVRLFNAFPASGRANADVLQLYCDALAEFPIEVAEDAVELFVRGKVEGYTADFVPPVPKLYRILEARKIGHQLLAERRKRQAVAPVKPLPAPAAPRTLRTQEERAAFVRKLTRSAFRPSEKDHQKTN